ncbi:DUF6705 family protein [Mesonia sp. K4-1]|uniref:DUF6705 family protein n=1 Tax=Mesonia sp. K4-1 TaxID=2602760 RepID=UPI0011C765C9|nr:DUF6705 family protein [Mesonia sp. K4-1]TXK75153.1 hypothetical protein FT986_10125 [Mesonia sp. K4-1]
MKIIYIIIFAITFSFTSFGQSPIIDIEQKPSFRNTVANTYYKDVNNFMDPFEGTWLYTNGNTSYKIVLRKEEMVYTGKYYKDYIKGEYQYIENGIEIANTLANTDPYNIGISGDSFLKPEHRPVCNDCPANERRVQVTIYDRISGLNGTITLKLTTVNGQPAIEGFIWGEGPYVIIEGNPPAYTEMVIPTGTFTFIKQ